MEVCIHSMTYKEWLSTWACNTPEDFGLKKSRTPVQTVEDIDDLDYYQVVNEKLFFLAAIKYGFKYHIVYNKA